MSPELSRQFETEWPLLARRLKALLARKQVPVNVREDLIQDTALRLYGIWEQVDQTRSAWPLTATIALNLMRDQGRRVELSRSVAQCPELTFADDVEQVALARVELQRVRAALALMTPEQQAVLLAEIGISNGSTPTAATKMRRHRARRKLRQVLERAIAVFVFPARRMADIGQGILALRESLVKAGSCAACLFIGSGSLVAVPLEAAGVSGAAETRSGVVSALGVTAVPWSSSTATTSTNLDDAAFLAAATGSQDGELRSRSGGRAAHDEEQGTTTAAGSPTASGSGPLLGSGSGSGGGEQSPVPVPKEPIPSTGVGSIAPGEPEPVELPSTPTAPSAPSVPGSGSGEDQPQSVEEVVDEVEGAVETDLDVEVDVAEEDVNI